ncbi:hypothetical protein MHL30_16895 [Priestia flexa]|uniref:hypothetical protein n=1 Tax=Priestia flexa TaxID=86664 RepID=UPI001EF5F875|nr:hypothetical protein [Priestia flexa]MCG7314800.1 hypothetical protein [Priestia flexa]
MWLKNCKNQFKLKLIYVYDKSKLPRHFESFPKIIGINKWAAIYILVHLENFGYLERGYAENGKIGNPQIVFLPIEKAYHIFNSLSIKIIKRKNGLIRK